MLKKVQSSCYAASVLIHRSCSDVFPVVCNLLIQVSRIWVEDITSTLFVADNICLDIICCVTMDFCLIACMQAHNLVVCKTFICCLFSLIHFMVFWFSVWSSCLVCVIWLSFCLFLVLLDLCFPSNYACHLPFDYACRDWDEHEIISLLGWLPAWWQNLAVSDHHYWLSTPVLGSVVHVCSLIFISCVYWSQLLFSFVGVWNEDDIVSLLGWLASMMA